MTEDQIKAMEEKAKTIEALITKAVEETKNADKMSQETKTALNGHINEYNKLVENTKKMQEQIDKLELDSKRFSATPKELKSLTGEFDRLVKGELKSHFEDFKNRKTSRFTVQFKDMSLNDLHVKTAATMTTPANVVPPQYESGIFHNPERPRWMRDIIRVLPTSVDTIKYVRETAITDGAAMQSSQGAAKGQSDSTLAASSEPVETLATYLVISKQMLEDVPGMMAYLSTRFIGRMKRVEDTQILTGNGTAPNLNGLMTAAQAYDNTGGAVGSTINRFDVLMKAITQAKVDEFSPDWLILHPADVLSMKLTKATTGEYVFPFFNGQANVDNIRIFETTAMTSGSFLVGDFGMGCTLWDRQAPTIEMSDSDEDNFKKNLITVRFEERLALTVERPDAFVTDTFAHALAVGSA